MPFRIGAAPAPGGGLELAYAANLAETELDGAHAAASTVLTLDSVDGIQAGMTFGVGIESHKIDAVDTENSRITIAAPGLAANRADEDDVFIAPLFGRAAAGPYKELEARIWFEMLTSSGRSARQGHANGRFFGPGASVFDSLDGYNYWWTWSNTGTLTSYSVGAAHVGRTARHTWSLEYHPATNRLSLLHADADQTPTYYPRINSIVLAGRA